MKFRAIIFDLDGTLLNTLEDLGRSMNAVLSRMGFSAHDIPAYRHFVGEGIGLLARRALPAHAQDDATVAACVAAMRDEYNAHCTDTTAPYSGIQELLDGLAEKDLRMAVLSNKPDDMVKFIVKKYFPEVKFDAVFGVRESVPRKPDPAGALEIARLLEVEPACFVYLGDSKTDMQTAVAANMFPVGALWGFRDAEELSKYGAKALIKHPLELLEIITRRPS